MAGFSLATAQAQLDIWIAAETALAKSQSYTIATADGNSRTLTRANLKDVAERINYWRAEVAAAERAALGTRRTRYFVN